MGASDWGAFGVRSTAYYFGGKALKLLKAITLKQLH